MTPTLLHSVSLAFAVLDLLLFYDLIFYMFLNQLKQQPQYVIIEAFTRLFRLRLAIALVKSNLVL